MFALHQRMVDIAHSALLEFLQTQASSKSYQSAQSTALNSSAEFGPAISGVTATSGGASPSSPSKHFVTALGQHHLDPKLVSSGSMDLDFLLFVTQPSIASLAASDPVAYARAIANPNLIPQSLRHLLQVRTPQSPSAARVLSNSPPPPPGTDDDQAAQTVYAQTLQSAQSLADAFASPTNRDDQRIFQHQLLLQSSLHTSKARAFVRVSADQLMDLVEEKILLIPALFERLQRENHSNSNTVSAFPPSKSVWQNLILFALVFC